VTLSIFILFDGFWGGFCELINFEDNFALAGGGDVKALTFKKDVAKTTRDKNL